MAKVIITLEDMGDGLNIKVSPEFYPDLPNDIKEATGAQVAGAIMLSMLQDMVPNTHKSAPIKENDFGFPIMGVKKVN